MGYYQPEENVRAFWRDDGGADFWLNYQGRDWYRGVAPDEPVSVIEAAALMGRTRSAVYDWIRSGRLLASEAEWQDGRPVTVVYLDELRRFGLANGYLRPG